MRNQMLGVLRSLVGICLVIQIGFGLLWAGANIFCSTQVFLSVVQLLFAFAAGYFCFALMGKNTKESIFGSLAILTVPPVLQGIVFNWLSALMWSLGVCVIGLVFKEFRCKKGIKAWRVVPVLFVIVCFLPGRYLGQQMNQVSLYEPAMNRICWPYAAQYYEEYPEDFKEKFEIAMLTDLALYQDGFERKFFPKLETVFTQEEIEQICGEMIRVNLSRNIVRIGKDVMWDLIGYNFPTIILPYQLEGETGISISGVNYAQFREAAPVLSAKWVEYQQICTILCMVASVGIFLLGKRRKESMIPTILCGLALESMVFLYILQGAGRMDYKNSILLVSMIFAVFVQGATQKNEE